MLLRTQIGAGWPVQRGAAPAPAACCSPAALCAAASLPRAASCAALQQAPSCSAPCSTRSQRLVAPQRRLRRCQAGLGDGLKGLGSLLNRNKQPSDEDAAAGGWRGFGVRGIQGVDVPSTTAGTAAPNGAAPDGNGAAPVATRLEGNGSAPTDAWGLHADDWDEDWDPSVVQGIETGLGDMRDTRPVANEASTALFFAASHQRAVRPLWLGRGWGHLCNCVCSPTLRAPCLCDRLDGCHCRRKG